MTRSDALTQQITRLQTQIARDKQLGKRTGALEALLCNIVAERMRLGLRTKRHKEKAA